MTPRRESTRREPPRLLLSARSLDGLTRATHDRRLEAAMRYRESESLAVTLSKALDAGAEGVLATPSPALRAALTELKRTVPIAAVLPALNEHDRLEMDPDLEALIRRRERLAGAGARVWTSLATLGRLPLLWRSDWSTQLPVLIELEAAALRRRELWAVVLSADLTDRALAAGNRGMFEVFCRFVRRRFRAHAALETRNLGVLLARLAEWSMTPDFIVGPVNPRGLVMKPSAAEVLEQLRRSSVPVVATELRAGGNVTLAEGARYAREHGARGVAPDLVDLDDVAELKALVG